MMCRDAIYEGLHKLTLFLSIDSIRLICEWSKTDIIKMISRVKKCMIFIAAVSAVNFAAILVHAATVSVHATKARR